MRNGTQFGGMVLAALGVAVLLRGSFEANSLVMAVLGALGAAAGFALIWRGHYGKP
jgi:hypothetical protein